MGADGVRVRLWRGGRRLDALVPDRREHTRIVKICERGGNVPSDVWVAKDLAPAGLALDPPGDDQQRPLARRFDRRHPTGEPRSTESEHGDALARQLNSCLR